MGLFGMIKERKELMRAEALSKARSQATSDADKLRLMREERAVLEKRNALRTELRDESKRTFQARNPVLTRAVENAKSRLAQAKANKAANSGSNAFSGSLGSNVFSQPVTKASGIASQKSVDSPFTSPTGGNIFSGTMEYSSRRKKK